MRSKHVLPAARRGRGQLGGGVANPQTPIATRLAVFGAVGVTIFFVLLLRLWALTVMNGSQYAELAQQNQLRRLPIEAPRGRIIDRRGNALVTNRPAREVVLNVYDVPEELRPALYSRLADALDMRVTEVREIAERGAFDPLTPVVIAKDVTRDEIVFYLEEHKDEFPGVDVRERYVRSYAEGHAAAHMLGQVGEVSSDQLEDEFENLKPGDHVGQSGLERTYDEYLRGQDGYRAVEVDAMGVRHGDGRGVPATPGRNLRLSVDLGLQRAAERGLAEGMKVARSTADGRGADAGAVVAMTPAGEVLAMVSHPGYDPNIFVTAGHDREIRAVLKNRRSPLSNRALEGLYPPGSTYKVISGIAAMEEGYVTPSTPLQCPPSKTIANKRFNNWTQTHFGAIDLATALEISCDTYFYELAIDFYNADTPLQDWSRKMGLGARTGIDLPGEQEGVIPDADWRRRTFEGSDRIWGPGHSVNMSIGQGDVLVTPLQMTTVYAALANDGKVPTPRLASSVEEPSGKEVVRIKAGPVRDLELPRAELAAIQDGLQRVANGPNGTATAVFEGFPVQTAGKTGTAEKFGEGDMAWYCGYAPAVKPEIVACAVVERGGHGGTAAAPVVLKVFQQWFGKDGGNVAGGVGSE